MLHYHHSGKGYTVAELIPGPEIIKDADDILQLMVDAGYHGNSIGLIIHQESLPADFFDLKTGIAGDILQKFSNYRMKLAIIGDYSNIRSKSLADFIRESNRGKLILFAGSVDEAVSKIIL